MRYFILASSLVAGLASIPFCQGAAAAPVIAAVQPVLGNSQIEPIYYYHGRYYPYYYRGHYYPYRYNGHYYNHRAYQNGHWRYY